MDIKLYYTPRSRAVRVRWMLEELTLPYELINIDLMGGEANTDKYKKINPFGYIPAVEIGGKPMFESVAICHWLTEQYPEKNLAPAKDSWERAIYEQWMYFVPGSMEPPIFTYLLHKVVYPESMRVPEILPWALERYKSILKELNEELKSKPYLLGEQLTTADIMMASILFWKEDLLEEYPALKSYSAKMKSRPAYIKATKD